MFKSIKGFFKFYFGGVIHPDRNSKLEAKIPVLAIPYIANGEVSERVSAQRHSEMCKKVKVVENKMLEYFDPTCWSTRKSINLQMFKLNYGAKNSPEGIYSSIYASLSPCGFSTPKMYLVVAFICVWSYKRLYNQDTYFNDYSAEIKKLFYFADDSIHNAVHMLEGLVAANDTTSQDLYVAESILHMLGKHEKRDAIRLQRREKFPNEHYDNLE